MSIVSKRYDSYPIDTFLIIDHDLQAAIVEQKVSWHEDVMEELKMN